MNRAVLAAVLAALVGVALVGVASPVRAQQAPDAGAAEAPAAGDTATPEPDSTPEPEVAQPDVAPETVAVHAPIPPGPTGMPAGGGGLHADLLGANIPLRFTLNGYFRTRFVYANNVPGAPTTTNYGPVDAMGNPTDPTMVRSVDSAHDLAFAYMRLRLEPSITYGSNPEQPLVALRSQIDLLDNVVFGDNARLASTPIFVEGPSSTSITGTDGNMINIRRLWLEFLTPVGVIRVGRQGSHGGLGLLFNDGNGFRNDWGDANQGSTYDRILFATRPLTIVNTLTRADSRSTPLVLAIGYDWLVEDPLGTSRNPMCLGGTGPAGTSGLPCVPSRTAIPYDFLSHGQQAVQEGILVLAWNDPKINPNRLSDELSLGLIGVTRSQGVTGSDVWIYDAFWRARYSVFGNRGVQPFTNGEIYTIQGQSYGVGLKGLSIDDVTGRTARPLHANIWGGAVQVGLANDQKWQIMVEGGYATGDAHLFHDPSRVLTQRAMSPDYKVGLLMFPLAIAAHSANALAASTAIQSRGGVWNASYIYPQARLRIFQGVDILGAMLFAWVDQFDDAAYTSRYAAPFNMTTQQYCGPGGTQSSNCFLGWEVDLGLKVSWGPNELMRWSTEVGWMEAGPALGPELSKQFLWTFQSRFAMSF